MATTTMTLPALFEEQVRASPDAIAVYSGDECVSFDALNQQANQFARQLQANGVTAGDYVLTCLARSVDAIAVILGIMKLGAAYVPVGLDLPQERRSFIVNDVAAKLVVVQDAFKHLFSQSSVSLLSIDSEGQEFGNYDFENIDLEVAPDDIAWVLYTSGSTGAPKGVLGTHRGSVNRIAWLWKSQPFYSGEVCFQNTTFGTVDSVWEIWSPLGRGHALRIFNDELVRDVQKLIPELAKYPIFRICLVPSLLSSILSVFPDLGSRVPQIKLWVTSGEVLPVEVCRQFYQAAPEAALFNQYGMTESCADITYFDTRDLVCSGHLATKEPPLKSIPIGRAIDNVQLYVMDEEMLEVSPGCEGELYVGGACLAHGYLNRPEVTLERFRRNPLLNRQGDMEGLSSVLYKTGDIVRLLSDGNLEFQGRMDDQVKLRGYRIELGEIETVLSNHKSVHQCVVVLQDDFPGQKRLAAYLVRKNVGTEAETEQEFVRNLREYITKRLPDHMVPSVFSILETMPLTATGKIDRKNLPKPNTSVRNVEGAFVVPRTPLEEWLYTKWSELLQMESIGVHDNFFTLGGNSLHAIQLLSRVRQHYEIELPLRSLFEHPTIAGWAEQIESGLNDVGAFAAPTIHPVKHDDCPLSFVQQRLWFLSQLLPDTSLYNIPFALRLRGNLHIAVLQQAFNLLLARHKVLRSRIIEEGGKARQVFAKNESFNLEQRDLRLLPEGERDRVLQETIRVEAARLFNLSTGPLIRGQLLCLGDDDHALLVTMHHIVIDDWSIVVMSKELSVLYNACKGNVFPSISDLPIQYADYAAWQRDWLQGNVLKQRLKFWKKVLAGVPEQLHMPTDYPRPAKSSYRGRRYTIQLPKHFLAKTKQLGEKQNATLFMTLLAAFQALLYRYSGQQDIVVGSPVANRHNAEVENLIGCFMNTVMFRTDFSHAPSFVELLSQVRETTLSVYAHQDFPFEQLVEYLNVNRDLSREALFQVMFALRITNRLNLKLNGLDAEYLRTETQLSLFDLTLWAEETVDGLELEFEYSTDLFKEATITRLATAFEVFLRGAILEPTRSVDELPIIDTKERHQQLVEWNNTATENPQSVTLTQMFEAQADRTPDRIALEFDGQQISYRELNAKANQLAHYLRTLNVGPEILVAICMERSLEMVVTLLGILKAGGAYLPLDPTYPQERLDYMLGDSQVQVLITQFKMDQKLANYSGYILVLEDGNLHITRQSEHNVENFVTTENLCYVIYTSGSTGKPKGVQVTHKSVVNLLCDMKSRLSVTEQDVLVAVTTISFDIAALELYLPLLVGAKVVVVPRDVVADGDALARLITAVEGTVMQATPATWRMLLDVGWEVREGFKILCGGETLSSDLAKSLVRGGAKVWNVYGPTETTIWSTVAEVDGFTDRILIGRPIANTQVYVLDEKLEVLPIGVPGELYIGGRGVARGYLNRSELTAERFIANPFDNNHESRIYKTGDLVRYFADGNIEFLNRVDNQIKIRGFRVELGEIERCLEQHPAVKQAIVTTHVNSLNDTRLVGHIIPSDTVSNRGIDFSLFYFAASSSSKSENLYRLYLEGAKYADESGFKAIWTPERHFHEVGGQYPNPSVLSAALAAITNRVELRAGSVVLPLHHPLRVAEEWAVVDNISNGRVGIAFASGWNPKDFAFFPQNYPNRREQLFAHVELVQHLWQRGVVNIKDGLGNTSEVTVFPKPKQAKLPTWITTASGSETFIGAGRIGANVLTHLLGQSIEELAEKISLYRRTLEEYGHDPEQGTVTLMLHTYIGESRDEAIETSRGPFCEYLRAHISLEIMADGLGRKAYIDSERDEDEIVNLAFERYVQTASLIGDVNSCFEIVKRLKQVSVDEIACFLDFGINEDLVFASLQHLTELKNRSRGIASIDPRELDRHLAKYVPSYMIPSAFAVYEALPMTLNGKVDRKHLAQLSQHAVRSEAPVRVPKSQIELIIAELWHKILGIEVKSVHDNFFALGGHSLLATQLVSRIRRRFSVELAIRSLFEFPTIEALAKQIESAQKEVGRIIAPPLVPVGRDGESILSFAQERLAFLDELLPETARSLYNTLLCTRLRGSLDLKSLERAFDAVLARHDILRSKIVKTTGSLRQEIARSAKFTLERRHFSSLTWAEQEAAVMREAKAEAARPFDLSTGPLIRGQILILGEADYVILITIHHIISDAWSIGVMNREVSAFYNAYRAGKSLDSTSSADSVSGLCIMATQVDTREHPGNAFEVFPGIALGRTGTPTIADGPL